MYPATMQKIGTTRGREMREQAAEWRSAQQAREAVRARPAGTRVAVVGRTARSLAG